jgi:hypothetical protein
MTRRTACGRGRHDPHSFGIFRTPTVLVGAVSSTDNAETPLDGGRVMSRPSKISPAVVARVAESMRAGLATADVAAHAGIGKRTLFRWLARARANRRCRTCPCRSSPCVRSADAPYVGLADHVAEIQDEQREDRASAYRMKFALDGLRWQGNGFEDLLRDSGKPFETSDSGAASESEAES